MSSFNNELSKTKLLLDNALEGVRLEIASHKEGCGGVSSLPQLGKIKVSLELMLSEVNNKTLSNTDYGLARIIVDSWTFDNELGKSIILSEKSYLKICSK